MKKISPNLLGFLLALIICIISLWVYFDFIQKKSIQLIDNPTNSSIQVVINNKTFDIAPNQYIEVNLEQGIHHIQVNADNDSLQLPATEFVVDSKRGLINPIQAPYFIFGMPYGPNVNKDSIFQQQKLTYQNKTYAGDVKVDSSLYIEDFYYNLNEDFPPITLKSENDSLRKKIFRKGDFKQFYFEHYE